MITGVVSAGLEPTITLLVYDANGQQHPIEIVIDTGFNGELALPASVVKTLGLAWKISLSWSLADGNAVDFDVYEAKVLWDGVMYTVDVEATGTAALLGTALLRGYRLDVPFEPGGGVRIEALP